MEMYNVETEKQGSVLRGLVGALIGAVLGAAVWGIVGILTQRVFSLLGILLGFLCAKGYELLKGREGVAKIVIVILCVILAVVLGEAIFAVGTFHQMYVESIDTAASELEMYGIDLKKLLEENPAEAYDKYLYTEAEMFKMALEDPEFWSESFKNLAQALIFAAIGAVVVIIDMNKKKQQPLPAGEQTEADGFAQPELQTPADESIPADKKE